MFIVERNREMSSLCLCKSPDRLGMYTCFIIFPKARAAWALKILNFNARLMGSVWRNCTWIAFHLPIRKKSDSLMFDEWLRTILPRRRFCRIRMCAIHFVWKLVSDQLEQLGLSSVDGAKKKQVGNARSAPHTSFQASWLNWHHGTTGRADLKGVGWESHASNFVSWKTLPWILE